MRSVSKVFVWVVFFWVTAVLVLMGCDRHGAPDDILSPRADIKITSLNLTSGAILSPQVSSSTANVSASSADFPQVKATLSIFNGIDVQLLDYRVDYFAEDGVTPLGLNAFGGLLTQLVKAGIITESGFSLTPSTSTLPPGQIRAGTVGTADILIKVVSDELRSFLAGPNGKFRTSTEDNTDTDDFRGLVVCQVKIRGVDINSNKIEIITRLTASATVPIAGTTTGP